MIYTLTFNPAIDYVMHPISMDLGKTNRSSDEEYFIGGKGINVSLVLRELDMPSVALGFTAGFTGAAVEEYMKTSGVDCDFVRLSSGFTRINLKIKGEEETELNGKGPDINAAELAEMMSKLKKLTAGDILVMAGSIPGSLPGDIYEKIMAELEYKAVLFVVDAAGKLLVNSLRYKPFLIKPNAQELSEIVGKELKTEEEIISAARELKNMGAKNVLVSMAGDGSILVDESDKVHIMGTAKGELVGSVGAGDSMVAGFLAGYIKTKDYAYALKLGTACGGATAFSTGLAKKEKIEELFASL